MLPFTVRAWRQKKGTSRAELGLANTSSSGKWEERWKKGQVRSRRSSECQNYCNDRFYFCGARPHPNDPYYLSFMCSSRVKTCTLTNLYTSWDAETAVFTQGEALGTFSHCHFTYFWIMELRCLVLGPTRTKQMRNSPGCLPGKTYFVIDFLTKPAWPKNRPASLPPWSRKQYHVISYRKATIAAGKPYHGSNPCHYSAAWAIFESSLSSLAHRSDIAVLVNFLKGKVTGLYQVDIHGRAQGAAVGNQEQVILRCSWPAVGL